MELEFDHLVICAQNVPEASQALAQKLGMPMQPGGHHATMGTYNTLLGLGPDAYLEVIGIDPKAPAPGRPRWFGLDQFRGPARLCHWVLRADDITAALKQAPPGIGTPMALARGDYRWTMAVPSDGMLPFSGVYPALIEWDGPLHPAPRLPESNCRLAQLRLTHPQAADIRRCLSGLHDPRVEIVEGPPGLAATLTTPEGRVTI